MGRRGDGWILKKGGDGSDEKKAKQENMRRAENPLTRYEL